MNGTVLLSVLPTPTDGIIVEADEFCIQSKFPVPNSCCICLEKFDGVETRVFDALPDLCHNHKPLIWLTDGASPENVATDLFAAFLRDPTFRCYRRVCTDCFEKSLLARLNNSKAFVAAREEVETDITLLIKCPICSVNNNASFSTQPTIWWQTTFGDNDQLQQNPASLLRRRGLFGDELVPAPRVAEGNQSGISVDALYQHVSPSLWHQISDAVHREYERRHRRLLYCPINGCEHFQDMREEEGIEEQGSSSPLVECVQHGKFCSLCWEPIVSPTSGRRSNNNDDDDGDGVTEDDVFGILEDCARFPRATETVIAHQCKGMPTCIAEAIDPHEHQIRRCPHCFAAIEQNAGCDQMFCTTCSRSFSWDNALRYSVTAAEEKATPVEPTAAVETRNNTHVPSGRASLTRDPQSGRVNMTRGFPAMWGGPGAIVLPPFPFARSSLVGARATSTARTVFPSPVVGGSNSLPHLSATTALATPADAQTFENLVAPFLAFPSRIRYRGVRYVSDSGSSSSSTQENNQSAERRVNVVLYPRRVPSIEVLAPHERMPRELSFSPRLLAEMFYSAFRAAGQVLPQAQNRLPLSTSLVALQQNGTDAHRFSAESIQNALTELRGELQRSAERERLRVASDRRNEFIEYVRLFEQAMMQAQIIQRLLPATIIRQPLSPVEQLNAKISDVMQQTRSEREEAMMALLLSDKDVTEAIFIVLERQGNTSAREDVNLVVTQTDATRENALRVYIRNRFDIVNAIMDLVE